MDITVEKLQSYTREELLSILEPFMKRIYQTYAFLHLSTDEYNQIILDGIDELKCHKQLLKDSTIDMIMLLNYSKYCMDQYVTHLLSEKDTSLSTILSYMADHVSYASSSKSALKELKKIASFFTSFHCEVTEDLLTELFQRSCLFSSLTKSIVDEHIDVIRRKELDTVFKNRTICSFVHAYCSYHELLDESIVDSDEMFYQKFIHFANHSNGFSDDITKLYLAEIQQPMLTPEETHLLLERFHNGEKRAKDILIERNLRLVVSVAYDYVGKGVDFLDLIQEGNMGLMKAIDKYNPKEKCKLSTYAYFWIRQCIERSVNDNGRNVRVPVRSIYQVERYKRTCSELEQELFREPTVREIAEKMNISFEKALELQALQYDALSLNMPISEYDDGFELGDVLPSSDPSVEDIVASRLSSAGIRDVLDSCPLDERHLQILALRHELDGTPICTYKEIGRQLNITQERVRQLYKDAFSLIKNSRNIELLASYMPDEEKALNAIGHYNKNRLSNYQILSDLIKKQKKRNDSIRDASSFEKPQESAKSLIK